MKNFKSKKFNKRINTICDFNHPHHLFSANETVPPTGTDPTNTTIITITTVNTGIAAKS